MWDQARCVDKRRTVIPVESIDLASSLVHRLEEIRGTGARGLSVDFDQSEFAVVLDEYPRRPEDTKKVLDVVAAWLDEIGHPEVTVEFRWPVRRSPAGTSRAKRTVIYWKCEVSSADPSREGRLDDAGPAWLQTHDEHGNVMSEPVAEGNWITRNEAIGYSLRMGYTLSLDE